jgi:hypothetical protein
VQSALRIPVIGLGEAARLLALTLGRKVGLITINPILHLLARGPDLVFNLVSPIVFLGGLGLALALSTRTLSCV